MPQKNSCQVLLWAEWINDYYIKWYHRRHHGRTNQPCLLLDLVSLPSSCQSCGYHLWCKILFRSGTTTTACLEVGVTECGPPLTPTNLNHDCCENMMLLNGRGKCKYPVHDLNWLNKLTILGFTVTSEETVLIINKCDRQHRNTGQRFPSQSVYSLFH
jgi:hypothetical protein